MEEQKRSERGSQESEASLEDWLLAMQAMTKQAIIVSLLVEPSGKLTFVSAINRNQFDETEVQDSSVPITPETLKKEVKVSRNRPHYFG